MLNDLGQLSKIFSDMDCRVASATAQLLVYSCNPETTVVPCQTHWNIHRRTLSLSTGSFFSTHTNSPQSLTYMYGVNPAPSRSSWILLRRTESHSTGLLLVLLVCHRPCVRCHHHHHHHHKLCPSHRNLLSLICLCPDLLGSI